MDELLRKTRRWSLPMIILFYRGIPSAFFICSFDLIAPSAQPFWCVDKNGIEHKDHLRQCTINGTECVSYSFESGSGYGNTLLAEFSAVCDRQWLTAWGQSALMFGMMLGNLFFSHVSDWYGRRTIIFLSHMCILIGGILSSVAPTFEWWISFRVLMSLGLGGNQNGPFTLGMESTNPEKRATIAVGDTFGWVMGMILLSLFPLVISDWRTLLFTLSFSTVPVFIMASLVDESPRWLLATGKLDRARKAIRNILRRNDMSSNESDVEEIMEKCLPKRKEETDESKASLLNLMGTKQRFFTTATLYIIYPINILVYYQLLYWIIELDNGGYFGSLVWAGLFEIPTFFLVFVLVKYCRRRTIHILTLSAPILSCGLLALIQIDNPAFKLALATCAKLGVQVGFSVLGVHVNELYPTRIRGIALGSCIMISRLGAIVAPFTHKQKLINENIINSIGCLVALCFTLNLRETFGEDLPDRFNDEDDSESKRSVS